MQNQDADQQAMAHKHRLQTEVLMKDGEYKRNERRKLQLNMQIKQTQRKMDILKIELERDKIELQKIELSQMEMEKEIKKMKKEVAGMQ